jgi:hypothetical protein
MNSIPAGLRWLVVFRAGDRCEYCGLAQEGQGGADHRAAGGPLGELAGNQDSRNRLPLDTEHSWQIGERKIGGLAIRESGGRRQLVIGVCAPADKVRAFAADITATPSPDASLELRPTFTFDAGECEGIAAQLTSLEYVPAMSGFLVLTATEDADNVFHGNTIWLVADGETRRARAYGTFEVAMKAGGLAVLGVKASGHLTTISLLITYDNDPHATKIPSRFQTATLVHERT